MCLPLRPRVKTPRLRPRRLLRLRPRLHPRPRLRLHLRPSSLSASAQGRSDPRSIGCGEPAALYSRRLGIPR
eukprot:9497901-Lingulodinium_polyedra.AAC.1